MTRAYRGDAMAAIHESMEVLHEAGAADKASMRKFDEACLMPMEIFSPEKIGILAGRLIVPDDFDAPLPDDVLGSFEGR